MSKLGDLGHRLYTGDVSYDFIAKRRRWYLFSGAFVAISIISLLVRGFNPSIEFQGGAQFQFDAKGHSLSQAESAVHDVIGNVEVVTQKVGTGSNEQIRVTTPELTADQMDQVENSLHSKLGVSIEDLNPQQIGATWGSDITKKAIQALIVFLVLVIVYLSLRYEFKMALAAIVAVIHDVLITAGIYSLVGFEVSPSTVVALLTILGYSLYDTVVVFDKVRENTKDLGPQSDMTFSEATNLAVNQTLARSINTSVISLLPVAGLLFIGAGILGAGTLKDLSLAMFIGLAAGTYSSIFVASPLLCDFKERESGMRELSRRVSNRRAVEAKTVRSTAVTATVAAAGVGALSDDDDDTSTGPSRPTLRFDQGATVRNEDAVRARRKPGSRRR